MGSWRLVGVTVILAVIALESVSVDRGHTFEVVDDQGRPVAGAYLAYNREGSSGLGLAHPVTYQASPLDLVRTDANGRALIVGRWTVHWPAPIQFPPKIVVSLVYAPTLHNGLKSVRGWTFLQPGVTVVGPRHARIQLADLQRSPDQWFGSIGNLSSLIGDLSGDRASRDSAARVANISTLVDVMTAEYAEYLARFRDTRRPDPREPRWDPWHTDVDKRQWREAVDRDLAESPTWAERARREYGGELERRRESWR